MSARPRVGVWGVGVWGEKHARVWHALAEEGQVEWVGLYDHHPGRAEAMAAQYGGRAFESAEALLREVDAVSVTVPTIAHREAAETALGAGVHVLVEKPMAVTTAEADSMLAAARRAGKQLQVGQVERFNPAVSAARAVVRRPMFIESHRLALFQPRSLDIDVVFDLMIHDIDLVLEFTGHPPEQLSAVGVAVLSQSEDIANARLEFADGCVANLTASRVSQERLRRIRFFQSDAYISVDLFERKGEMLRVDRDAPAARALPGLPAIQGSRLAIGEGEPLRIELAAFADSLSGIGPGAASGAAGREALRVAEEVREAMRRRSLQWTAR